MKKLVLLIPFLVLTLFFLPTMVATSIVVVRLPLDCRQSAIQAGVPVRRNSDGRITKVDVCGAADSGDDTFRDIPYQAHCEHFDTGEICR